jgi:hypothetical protein
MTQPPVRFAILGFDTTRCAAFCLPFKVHRSKLNGMWRRVRLPPKLRGVPDPALLLERRCVPRLRLMSFAASPDAMHWDDTLLALRYGKAVRREAGR